MSAEPAFLLVICHVGAESFLRTALAPWRPAFARPGLLTLKHVDGPPPTPDLPRPHPLVRTWGLSLGRAVDAAEVVPRVEGLPWPLVLQVQAGEGGPPGQVPPKILARWAEVAREAEDRLVETLGDRVSLEPARLGDRVLDVIVRPDEPWVLAHHTHDLVRGPLPGGRWPLQAPADAPSRAWAKIEELFAFAGDAPGPGQVVLEIGAAPGGATVAMLDRGATVVSVDPKPFDLPPRLAGAPHQAIRLAIEGVPRDALPDRVDWLVVDVSMAAPLAVKTLERLVPRYRRTLRGAFVTLKLNEWAIAERIPGLYRQLETLGFTKISGANLPSFRQEIGIHLSGLDRKDGSG